MMNDYPAALVEKVVAVLAADLEDEPAWSQIVIAKNVLDALGFAPHIGSIYWRSAIHVEASK